MKICKTASTVWMFVAVCCIATFCDLISSQKLYHENTLIGKTALVKTHNRGLLKTFLYQKSLPP